GLVRGLDEVRLAVAAQIEGVPGRRVGLVEAPGVGAPGRDAPVDGGAEARAGAPVELPVGRGAEAEDLARGLVRGLDEVRLAVAVQVEHGPVGRVELVEAQGVGAAGGDAEGP